MHLQLTVPFVGAFYPSSRRVLRLTATFHLLFPLSCLVDLSHPLMRDNPHLTSLRREVLQ